MSSIAVNGFPLEPPAVGSTIVDQATQTTYLRGVDGWHKLLTTDVLSDAEMRALFEASGSRGAAARRLADAIEETARECGILPSTKDRG